MDGSYHSLLRSQHQANDLIANGHGDKNFEIDQTGTLTSVEKPSGLGVLWGQRKVKNVADVKRFFVNAQDKQKQLFQKMNLDDRSVAINKDYDWNNMTLLEFADITKELLDNGGGALLKAQNAVVRLLSLYDASFSSTSSPERVERTRNKIQGDFKNAFREFSGSLQKSSPEIGRKFKEAFHETVESHYEQLKNENNSQKESIDFLKKCVLENLENFLPEIQREEPVAKLVSLTPVESFNVERDKVINGFINCAEHGLSLHEKTQKILENIVNLQKLLKQADTVLLHHSAPNEFLKDIRENFLTTMNEIAGNNVSLKPPVNLLKEKLQQLEQQIKNSPVFQRPVDLRQKPTQEKIEVPAIKSIKEQRMTTVKKITDVYEYTKELMKGKIKASEEEKFCKDLLSDTKEVLQAEYLKNIKKETLLRLIGKIDEQLSEIDSSEYNEDSYMNLRRHYLMPLEVYAKELAPGKQNSPLAAERQFLEASLEEDVTVVNKGYNPQRVDVKNTKQSQPTVPNRFNFPEGIKQKPKENAIAFDYPPNRPDEYPQDSLVYKSIAVDRNLTCPIDGRQFKVGQIQHSRFYLAMMTSIAENRLKLDTSSYQKAIDEYYPNLIHMPWIKQGESTDAWKDRIIDSNTLSRETVHEVFDYIDNQDTRYLFNKENPVIEGIDNQIEMAASQIRDETEHQVFNQTMSIYGPMNQHNLLGAIFEVGANREKTFEVTRNDLVYVTNSNLERLDPNLLYTNSGEDLTYLVGFPLGGIQQLRGFLQKINPDDDDKDMLVGTKLVELQKKPFFQDVVSFITSSGGIFVIKPAS